MTDVARGDEDRLPWLEPVEDEDAGDGVSAAKMIAAVVMALVALGLIVGGVFWLRDRASAADGTGELIAAPEGPYKVRPEQPGGMQVEGQGDTAYAASEGVSTNAAIDLSALPEAPVREGVTSADAAATGQATPAAKAPPASGAAPAPAPKIAAAPKAAPPIAAAPPKAEPAPVETAPSGGGTIQLGAFSSEAKAKLAWKTMTGRFSYLAGLTPQVMPVTSGASTLYRLRVAAGGQAGALCGRLKVAGETCQRIN